MRANNCLTLCCLFFLTTTTTLWTCSHAKPLDDLAKTDTELSDLNAPAKNKTAASGEEDSESDSSDLTQRAFAHRDEDQLNTATNLVLARNYKYDFEILESGDNDNDRDDSKDAVELEERYRGHGIYNTDPRTFVSDNIEMTPVDVKSGVITEGHMFLSIALVVLALASIGVYAALVIWRSHLEQRYGMREQLVNRDLDEEGIDDVDYHVAYPHTLSPYAPTTTPTNNTNSLARS
ncbi:uncharacterized protein LOC115621315 [Scaptodrosophila lebanonensis]|uniref:Uncharacterized protein LOC115621315 n=1 Tax=Drosophila lebanonensis TaxID=7225 RepID=A0A6J2T778_DROLE|nr:uncharacterized protein LOC115621315 [Scaptodrosophila lebanonensis]